MRQRLILCLLIALCGCQQNVAVPTAQQLIANPQLLSEWQTKCNTGTYSQLSSERKAVLCSTTQEATISVAEVKQAKEADEFYDENTIRKK